MSQPTNVSTGKRVQRAWLLALLAAAALAAQPARAGDDESEREHLRASRMRSSAFRRRCPQPRRTRPRANA